MGSTRVFSIADKRSSLKFLYHACSMEPLQVDSWLDLDEFVERVYSLKANGVQLDDAIILSITENLYTEIMKDRHRYPKFKRQNAMRGIRRLREALGITVQSSEVENDSANG